MLRNRISLWWSNHRIRIRALRENKNSITILSSTRLKSFRFNLKTTIPLLLCSGYVLFSSRSDRWTEMKFKGKIIKSEPGRVLLLRLSDSIELLLYLLMRQRRKYENVRWSVKTTFKLELSAALERNVRKVSTYFFILFFSEPNLLGWKKPLDVLYVDNSVFRAFCFTSAGT